MRNTFIITVLIQLLPFIGTSQNNVPKILICSQLDSISDYIIWYTPTRGEIDIDDKYLFNQTNFVKAEFNKRLNNLGYEVISNEIPEEFKGRLQSYFSNKASDKFGEWLSHRYQENIRYVIILDKLILPSDITNYSLIDSNLNGEEFGIVTYYGKKRKIIVYSLINYLIFDTRELRRIPYRYHEPFVKEWRKVLTYKEKVTDKGFIVDDKIMVVKSELDSLFLYHINKVSDLITKETNALEHGQ